jgi:hypothetical protein
MNEKDSEAPFPREPWKRLLETSDEGPPETTDARIRAAASRDLVPRGRRWWLPASLAASFVLAVLVVHSEFGTIRRPLVDESDRGEGVAIHGTIVDREKAEEPRAPGQSPKASASIRTDLPRAAETESDDFGAEDSEFAADAGGMASHVGGPEREARAASEVPEEVLANTSPRIDLPREASPAAAPPPTAAFVEPPKPEAWYVAIEALRKAGRNAEADAELARFEAAYPDWIKKQHRKRP